MAQLRLYLSPSVLPGLQELKEEFFEHGGTDEWNEKRKKLLISAPFIRRFNSQEKRIKMNDPHGVLSLTLSENHHALATQQICLDPRLEGFEEHITWVSFRTFFQLPLGQTRQLGFYRLPKGKADGLLGWQQDEGGRYILTVEGSDLFAVIRLTFLVGMGAKLPVKIRRKV